MYICVNMRCRNDALLDSVTRSSTRVRARKVKGYRSLRLILTCTCFVCMVSDVDGYLRQQFPLLVLFFPQMSSIIRGLFPRISTLIIHHTGGLI